MAAPTAPAPARNAPTSQSKQAAKMHKRSRSGCFTCRLRRKKCEEGRPACKACRLLGLRCDYKRPIWWSNGGERRAQKEIIKDVIKQSQLAKKASHVDVQQRQQEQRAYQCSTTPPSLCHSGPTSSEHWHDSMPPTHIHSSVGTPFAPGYEFAHAAPESYFGMPPPPPPMLTHPQYPMFSPYEIDIKTERQYFVNDVPMRKDSTISTFSTYQPPTMEDGMPAYPEDSWVQHEHHESLQESFTEEPVDFSFFQFPHANMGPGHEAIINVEDCDKYLLNHFLDKVLKLIFPILDANQHGSARMDVIVPALESNTAYLHCCLSIAATHMKATESLSGEQIDNDIIRHRYAAVSELCEALSQDVDHAGILEATLGMIFFQCSVGRPDDSLPDIPWHQHFEAVTNLVHKLNLSEAVMDLPNFGYTSPPFNMALTSWIDILGSTMLGRPPLFSDTYRDLNVTRGSAGLAELMGCDDKIMFLISEIACLEASKLGGMDDLIVCKYVEIIALEFNATDPGPGTVQNCFSTTGAIRPKQLAINITAVFRTAARIYLCSLVPGFEPSALSNCHLIAQFVESMNYIPAGPEGFDRSLVWPLLMAGSCSIAESPFRAMFEERCQGLDEAAHFGSFGRMRMLLTDLWEKNDAEAERGGFCFMHWRDVMRQKGWDSLLI